MRTTQRVERNTVVPLEQAFSTCLGVTSTNSYLYIFYPNTIRVYQQFPNKIIPQLCEQFIISQGNIVLYAVSKQYIAMLFEDLRIEVRLREYWQKVQYSLNLPQKQGQITSLAIQNNKIILKYLDQSQLNCYAFITIQPNFNQSISLQKVERQQREGVRGIHCWRDHNDFRKVLYLDRMGDLQSVYFGLRGSSISYGVYFQTGVQAGLGSQFKEFQFGKLLQQNHQIQNIYMLKKQKTTKCLQKPQISNDQQYFYYLVKILRIQEQKQLKKKKVQQENKIIIKYRIFYQDFPIKQNSQINQQNCQIKQEEVRQQEQESIDQQLRLKKYKKMMNTLLQLQTNNTVNPKAPQLKLQPPVLIDLSNDQQQSLKQSNKSQIQKEQTIQIILVKGQRYVSSIQKQEEIYVSTNRRVFVVNLVDDQTVGARIHFRALCKFDRPYKLVEICNRKLYLSQNHLCVYKNIQQQQLSNQDNRLTLQQNTTYQQNQQQQPQKQQQQINQNEQQQKIKSPQKIVVSDSKIKIDQAIQTQQLSDVLLGQIEEKQLNQMIGHLFEKKQVADVSTQTQQQELHTKQQQIQVDQGQVQPVLNSQIADQKLIKQYKQQSVGHNVPICPQTHQSQMSKIQRTLSTLHQQLHHKTMSQIQVHLSSQQSALKSQLQTQLQHQISTTMLKTILPLLQSQIDRIFQAKLQEVNVYIYSLAMHNLLMLKEEIEKDEVKENMLRTQLIKKELYEVVQSKKAVGEMVEVCKRRELQKIVFFEGVRRSFAEIEARIGGLQDKIRLMIEGQVSSQNRVLDQIQSIKMMLNSQIKKATLLSNTTRKKSYANQKNGDRIKQDQEQSQEQQFSQNIQEEQDGQEQQLQSLSQQQSNSDQNSQSDIHRMAQNQRYYQVQNKKKYNSHLQPQMLYNTAHRYPNHYSSNHCYQIPAYLPFKNAQPPYPYADPYRHNSQNISTANTRYLDYHQREPLPMPSNYIPGRNYNHNPYATQQTYPYPYSHPLSHPQPYPYHNHNHNYDCRYSPSFQPQRMHRNQYTFQQGNFRRGSRERDRKEKVKRQKQKQKDKQKSRDKKRDTTL